MKIAVSTVDNKGLETELDSRFGRASYFAVVDTTDNSIEFIANGAKNASSGAGVQAAQTVADAGVDVLISGNIGPKAFQGLSKTDIEIYSAAEKTVEEVIADYEAGSLEELTSATNSGHAGLK